MADQFSVLNVFRYITVRTFISFFTGFALCLIWGPHFINRLKLKHFGQTIREDGPQTHKKKSRHAHNGRMVDSSEYGRTVSSLD